MIALWYEIAIWVTCPTHCFCCSPLPSPSFLVSCAGSKPPYITRLGKRQSLESSLAAQGAGATAVCATTNAREADMRLLKQIILPVSAAGTARPVAPGGERKQQEDEEAKAQRLSDLKAKAEALRQEKSRLSGMLKQALIKEDVFSNAGVKGGTADITMTTPAQGLLVRGPDHSSVALGDADSKAWIEGGATLTTPAQVSQVRGDDSTILETETKMREFVSTLRGRGAVEKIITLLLDSNLAADLILLACSTLRNLASNPTSPPETQKPPFTISTPASFAERIIRADGVSAILAVMRRFPHDAELQEQACGVLCNLAHKNVDRKLLIASAGGAAMIVEAMRLHLQHVGVQKWGCWAITNLAASPNVQKAVNDAGCLERVLFAMRHHLSSFRVQERGCRALRNLSHKNNDIKLAIFKAGGAECVLAGMRYHPTHPDIQEQGCAVLWNLATTTTMATDTTAPQATLPGGQEPFYKVLLFSAAAAPSGNMTSSSSKSEQDSHTAELLKRLSQLGAARTVGCLYLSIYLYKWGGSV